MTTETTAKAPSTSITVRMDDGRDVAFAGKRKMIKETTIDADKNEVITRLDFVNGETRYFNVPASLILRFAAHGAEQKLGDEIAGVTDTDDCVAAIDELLARLDKGEWNIKREGGNGASGSSILVKALIELTGKTRQEIAAFLSDKSHAEKMALRSNKSLKPIVERLESEKASRSKKEGVDSDKLLGDLTGEADAPAEEAAAA